MPDFTKLVASSAGGGFQYYDIQTFSFAVPGQFLPKVGSSSPWFRHYIGSLTIPKSRPITQGSDVVITDDLFNVDVSDAAGVYHYGSAGATITTGSSGGFPIFYSYDVSASSDANNIIITLDVGNGSAVNDVTPPTITVSGKIFFYLAPF